MKDKLYFGLFVALFLTSCPSWEFDDMIVLKREWDDPVLKNNCNKSLNKNELTEMDISPLMYYVICGDIERCEEELNKGVEINCKNKEGNSAVFYASAKGDIEIVKLLVSRGANINIQNKLGHTPLMVAISENKNKVFNFLLSKGANFELKDKEGDTCLLYAIKSTLQYEESTFLEDLLNESINLSTKRKNGRTYVFYALEMGNSYALGLLLKAGGNKNEIINADKETLLMFATRLNIRYCAKELIKAGADLNAKNIEGETALDIAKRLNHSFIIELIEKAEKQSKL